jgi:hypothetical protein
MWAPFPVSDSHAFTIQNRLTVDAQALRGIYCVYESFVYEL